MFNRAEIVDGNFIDIVKKKQLPEPRVFINLQDSGLSRADLMDLFESQIISRQLDLVARELKTTNRCFYTIGSSGHEGNAAFGKAFRYNDMAFLHYRSCALMIQRSKQLPGSTPIYDILLSLVASSEDPISGGRHKVFGSRPLFVPPQTSTIASHLPKAVGMALSISRTRDLNLDSDLPKDSLVLCSFGDASINHSTALGAFNTAEWVAYQNLQMPIVFICEDNGLGISVPTPVNWVEKSFSKRPVIKYFNCDGLNIIDTYLTAKRAEVYARTRRKPAFIHMNTVRLLGHAGSDVESAYNSIEKIELNETNDPLLHTARLVIENDLLNEEEIIEMYSSLKNRIRSVAEYAATRPKLETGKQVATTITANRRTRKSPPPPSDDERKESFEKEFSKFDQPVHMAKLINWTLHDLLLQYRNSLVFGEDVAQKGGVYHVTDGLFKKFGPKRVFNSPLDETSIIGSAIGLAHNGLLPIAEIQFLAYFHNAEDQLRGEAATLAFFSKGQFTNPMVLRIAGLAYQKGFGGHFHNDNSLAVFRDLPGVILGVPSNGRDAVLMLRRAVKEAHENGRIVVIVEPIALYMTKDLHEDGDRAWCFPYPQLNESMELGEIKVYGDQADLTILTYGNGVYYSLQAAKIIKEETGKETRIVDLRWVHPIPWEALDPIITESQKLLVVDECRKSGSMSEGLVSGLCERYDQLPQLEIVTADDCFIPLGIAADSTLPKAPEIVRAAKDLLTRKGSES